MRIAVSGGKGEYDGISRYAIILRGALCEMTGVYLRNHNVDLTHYVSPIMFPNRKFVVTAHDICPISHWNCVDYSKFGNRLRAFFMSEQIRRSFKAAKAIVCNSSQTLDEVNQFFPQYKDKTHWAKMAIDPKFKPHEKLGLHLDVAIGYDHRNNGLSNIMQLLSILESKGMKFSLLPLDGTIPESELVGYYNALDYYIDFALFRGFGYPIIEAASSGATVLTLRSAKIPAEVKACSIVVEDDVEAASQIESGERKFSPWKTTLLEMGQEMAKIYELAS